MDNRIDGFKCLINSLSRYFDCGWRACAIAQGYNEEQKQDMAAFLKDKPCDIFYFSDYIGAHSAKVYGLENVKSDIWCSLDDDMEIIEKTDYEAVAETLDKEKSYGFISCNWARTMALADKKVAENKYIKQKLVYTGGGLLFRDDIAEIIRGIPNRDYLFDDCLWAMYAYINGYENYRFMGSVTVHRICTKGGRRAWIGLEANRALPPCDLLNARKCKDVKSFGENNSYFICLDKDLTQKARELHKVNKKV